MLLLRKGRHGEVFLEFWGRPRKVRHPPLWPEGGAPAPEEGHGAAGVVYLGLVMATPK